MKTLLLILGILATGLAKAELTQVQIEITYKGIPSFTKDISDKGGSDLTMPVVTTKSGKRAVINLIRQFRVQSGPQKMETMDCDATLEITPVINGRSINIIGKNTLRYKAPSREDSVSSDSFISHETFFRGKLDDGTPTVVKGRNKEQIVITATQLNAEGKPIYQ